MNITLLNFQAQSSMKGMDPAHGQNWPHLPAEHVLTAKKENCKENISIIPNRRVNTNITS